MDEIERVEQRKVPVFIGAALVAFALLLVWLNDTLLSVLAAVVVALIVAGGYGARSLTREPNWACLQQEARFHGNELSIGRVWLGNLLPGLAFGAALLWWRGAA